jgi:carboxymethylenebutenolidase
MDSRTLAPSRLKVATLTERIELDGGMGAFVARPADDRPQGGVVVCHELFGVTMHVREVCERITGLGWTAIAPDLYHRTEPAAELAHDDAGREHGFELLRELTRDDAIADVGAAVDHVRAAGARRVALLGLSLGGHVAYLAATSIDVDFVICAYPGWLAGTEIGLSRPEPTLTLTPGIGGRVLILTGSDDHAVPDADRAAIAAALQAAGVAHEIVVYPGTPHGFLCDRRATYLPAQADDAWNRISQLLM